MSFICRTCFQKTTDSNFINLSNKSTDSLAIRNKLADCIPEILIDSVQDPIMCTSCLTSLNVSFDFKHRCLQSEARIRRFVEHRKSEKNGTELVRICDVLNNATPTHSSITTDTQDSDVSDKVEVTTKIQDFEMTTDVHMSTNNEEIDVEKHEIEEDEYKPFDLQFNSVFIVESHIRETSFGENTTSLINVNDDVQSGLVAHCQTEKPSDKVDFVSRSLSLSMTNHNSKIGALEDNDAANSAETHIRCRLYKCNNCNYSTNTRGNLVKHVKIHNGKKPFKCKVCNYRFSLNDSLRRHMKTHAAERSHRCEICNYRCSQKSNLNVHMKTHTGERSFECKLCNYRSIYKGHYNDHMKTHTGEKPFKCEVCNYRCSQKSNLNVHMQIHTGEKPFKCEMCDYRCSKSGRLRDHMVTHTGEKPFKCKMCNYTCIEKAKLNRHIKSHTDKLL